MGIYIFSQNKAEQFLQIKFPFLLALNNSLLGQISATMYEKYATQIDTLYLWLKAKGTERKMYQTYLHINTVVLIRSQSMQNSMYGVTVHYSNLFTTHSGEWSRKIPIFVHITNVHIYNIPHTSVRT